MPEDASLNDFDADDSTVGDADDSTAVDEPTPTDDDGASHDPTPDPATATYRWSSESVACPDCETAVRRRWRDDDRFVCVDCKEW